MQEEIQQLKGPILVTIFYVCFWYFLLILQIKTKFRLIKKYKKDGKRFDRYFGQDGEMLASDRVVINAQEQMVPFIISLWLCALFSSPVTATWCGSIYIGLRLLYPILLGKTLSHLVNPRVFFVTFPSYVLIFYMLGKVTWRVLAG
ncbi:MAPEG family protein [Bacteriovoracaceae bacterium]|nr:MAPEG family protein [Bacteriovoracaceae bacterium]